MSLNMNATYLMIALFYSVLTFVVGPFVVPMFLNHKYNIELGFLLGFIVSIVLWMSMGKMYYLKSK